MLVVYMSLTAGLAILCQKIQNILQVYYSLSSRIKQLDACTRYKILFPARPSPASFCSRRKVAIPRHPNLSSFYVHRLPVSVVGCELQVPHVFNLPIKLSTSLPSEA